MPKEELIQLDLLYISATFMLCNRKREKTIETWGMFTVYYLQFYVHLGPKSPLDER
jgi:hypothetical protein